MLQSLTDDICYAMPVSDDGGSTFEIVKVMGGPGIGDIRSRLLGLANTATPEGLAIYKLLSYRLPTGSSANVHVQMDPAKLEWMSILEGNHSLWFARLVGCPEKTSVLPIVSTNHQPVSIGATLRNGLNIYGQCSISHPGVSAAPSATSPQHRYNSQQNRAESNPSLLEHSPSSSIPSQVLSGIPHRFKRPQSFRKLPLSTSMDFNTQSSLRYARSGASVGSSSSLDSTASNLFFSKSHVDIPPLPSPIRRVFYTTPAASSSATVEYIETTATVSPLVPAALGRATTVVYGIGSLYTSLLPSLIVPGVARGILQRPHGARKLLLVNGTHDRETVGYTGLDFVLAVVDALNCSVIAETGGGGAVKKVMTRRDVMTDMDGADSVWRWRGALVGTGIGGGKGNAIVGKEDLFAEGSSPNGVRIAINSSTVITNQVDRLGSDASVADSESRFTDKTEHELSEAITANGRGYLVKPYPPSAFITHLLYTEDSRVPINVDEIEGYGIKCIKVAKSGTHASMVASASEARDGSMRRVERGSCVNVATLSSATPGHFGVDELRAALAPLLLLHVDQAILSEEDRVVVIRFGHDWDSQCMIMDELLYSIVEKVKNFAVIYLVDITDVPDFNKMYELYDPCTVMFFYRNKHIMVDLGTGNNNKINWAMEDKQEMIDIIETVFQGARKGRGLVISPKDYSTKYKY
ncbi:Thioredoxin-like 4A [Entophlyctis sp. JEL0112]|nr:Thioredoxin-like 4A [Entophlyctis sp. JEL0112]